MRRSRPSRRILPAGLRSLPRRVFRFSIKRKQRAPKETPHPENPACNKRPSGHKICPDSHQRHIKYHRNGALSSRKTPKMPFFSSFCSEKRPLTFFALPFGADTCVARRRYSVMYSSTLPRAALPAASSRIHMASQKGLDQGKCGFGAPIPRARTRNITKESRVISADAVFSSAETVCRRNPCRGRPPIWSSKDRPGRGI